MITLKSIREDIKDYFLYDKARDKVLCFSNGDVVFYGSYFEASEDCYDYEEVLTYGELPKKWQETIKEQLQLKINYEE